MIVHTEWLSSLPFEKGVHFTGSTNNVVEELYARIRNTEGRILTDEEVGNLPFAKLNANLDSEWKLRRNTLSRWKKHLSDKSGKLALEVGCGNGWFASWLKKAAGYGNVCACDIHIDELFQAARVFGEDHLMWFQCADPVLLVKELRPNDVFFNASLQYFGETSALLKSIMEYLPHGGEIHILDTPVYPDQQAADLASQRSRKYYESKGVGEMSEFYHHIVSAHLPDFKWMYHPPKSKLGKWITSDYSPFPWLMYRKL